MCTRAAALAVACFLLAGFAPVLCELCTGSSIPEVRFCPADSYCCGETGCCPKDMIPGELTIVYTTLFMIFVLLLCCLFKRKTDALATRTQTDAESATTLQEPPPPFSSAVDVVNDPPPSYDAAVKMSPPDYDKVVAPQTSGPSVVPSEDPPAYSEQEASDPDGDGDDKREGGQGAPAQNSSAPEIPTSPVVLSHDSAYYAVRD